MITEQDIEKAAKEYTESSTIDGRIPYGIDDAEVLQEAFIYGAQWFKKNLWHDGSEEPTKKGMYLVYASYEYDEYPEDNYSEYTTSEWNGDWTEDHFPSEADVTIKKWCYIEDIQ